MIDEISLEADESAYTGISTRDLKKKQWVLAFITLPVALRFATILERGRLLLLIPFIQRFVKATVFRQFCGGTSQENSKEVIASLDERGISTVLDYAGEGFKTEEEFAFAAKKLVESLEEASQNSSISTVSMKVTSIARFKLLEDWQGQSVDRAMEEELALVRTRLDAICSTAEKNNVSLFVDAEESWIQHSINQLVLQMMKKYNQRRVIIYNTYQMYLTKSLSNFKNDFMESQEHGFFLGAKLVRGAYMEKERVLAIKRGHLSPVHETKEAVDMDFDEAIRFSLDHYVHIGVCVASHNRKSCELMASLIMSKHIPTTHPHLMFCQLYGMSDWISYKLALAGFNSTKYLPYGTVEELMPYLIRRAKENSSARSSLNMEHQLIKAEIKRRKQF